MKPFEVPFESKVVRTGGVCSEAIPLGTTGTLTCPKDVGDGICKRAIVKWDNWNKGWGLNVTNGPYWIVDWDNIELLAGAGATMGKNPCNCPIRTILLEGCRCGGV